MSKPIKFIFNIFAYSLIGLTVLVALTGYYFSQQYKSSGPLQHDIVFTVNPGDSTNRIAENLESMDIISSAFVFKTAAKLKGSAKALRAGEYEIQAGMSIEEVLVLMIKGKIKQYKITIPEGLTGYQIIRLLEKQDQMTGQVPRMIIEGTVLPDTYHFIRNEDMNAILGRMQDALTEQINELWANRAQGLPLRSTQDAITLASIVEKETGVANERRRVAGLFINRLKKSMPLQSDPTVIYALTEGDIQENGQGPLGRRLLRKDLDFDSPYNTYKYAGLPPGPIANPGLESIKAVLNPEEHEYYYMVADGTGGHAFASTLREHNANVAKWRKIRDAQ